MIPLDASGGGTDVVVSAPSVSEIVEKHRPKLLATVILGALARLSRLRPSVISLLIFAVIYIASAGWVHWQDPRAGFLNLDQGLLAAGTAYSLWVIAALYESIFQETLNEVMSGFEEEKGKVALAKWLDSFFSLVWQLTISAASAALVLLWFAMRHADFHVHNATYVSGPLCIFFVSNGAYCAVRLPRGARVTAAQRLSLLWFAPASTPWVRTLARGYNWLSTAEALALSLCIFLLYLLRPLQPGNTAIAGTWLTIGLGVIGYGILYPQYHLSAIVRRAHSAQLQLVQNAMQPFVERLGRLGAGEQKQFAELLDIYDRLLKARRSTFDFGTVGTLLTSLVFPAVPFITGILGLIHGQDAQKSP